MVNFPEDYAKQEKYYASESYQTYAKNAIDLSERDKKQAIKRLLKCDVSLITLEMLIFELVRDSKHEHFKELSNIIK